MGVNLEGQASTGRRASGLICLELWGEVSNGIINNNKNISTTPAKLFLEGIFFKNHLSMFINFPNFPNICFASFEVEWQ